MLSLGTKRGNKKVVNENEKGEQAKKSDQESDATEVVNMEDARAIQTAVN